MDRGYGTRRLMNPLVTIARNVLAELAHCVAHSAPALSSGRGDLFPSAILPFAAVRLKTSDADYLSYLAALPSDTRPNISKIVMVEDLPFQVVINGFVEVGEAGITINGTPATLL